MFLSVQTAGYSLSVYLFRISVAKIALDNAITKELHCKELLRYESSFDSIMHKAKILSLLDS